MDTALIIVLLIIAVVELHACRGHLKATRNVQLPALIQGLQGLREEVVKLGVEYQPDRRVGGR